MSFDQTDCQYLLFSGHEKNGTEVEAGSHLGLTSLDKSTICLIGKRGRYKHQAPLSSLVDDGRIIKARLKTAKVCHL